MAFVGVGSRWRRGPFPKRPEGVRLARLFRAGSPRRFPGAGGWAVGLGGASPGPVPRRATGPLRGGPWRLSALRCSASSHPEAGPFLRDRSASHRLWSGPACAGGVLTPVPSSASHGFCTPLRGLLAASRRSTSTLGGRLGRAGSMPRIRPRGISPARPLARPGWAGQHHPRPARLGRAALSHFEPPHRRRCGCHRLVEEL